MEQQSDINVIEQIIEDESHSWNAGDVAGFSAHFSIDGTFTNILGMFFTGQKPFHDRHEALLKGTFKNTRMEQQLISLQFIHSTVAVVETLVKVDGCFANPLPGI
jgi:uncharacterized protein (TIGR02246 family)